MRIIPSSPFSGRTHLRVDMRETEHDSFSCCSLHARQYGSVICSEFAGRVYWQLSDTDQEDLSLVYSSLMRGSKQITCTECLAFIIELFSYDKSIEARILREAAVL